MKEPSTSESCRIWYNNKRPPDEFYHSYNIDETEFKKPWNNTHIYFTWKNILTMMSMFFKTCDYYNIVVFFPAVLKIPWKKECIYYKESLKKIIRRGLDITPCVRSFYLQQYKTLVWLTAGFAFVLMFELQIFMNSDLLS